MKFSEWLKIKESKTYRGGKDTDWVSEDDYDKDTPYEVSPDYKTVLQRGGQHYRNKPRLAGFEAREAGQARTANPYPKGSKERQEWFDGWDDQHFISSPENFPGHEEVPYE